jgi:histidinol-phosphate/aromatic aminotransferase/cobyric acid decarboxylase-like protein
VSLRLHGDTVAPAGALDFAVNVWPGEWPAGLRDALERALADARYPDEWGARAAIAARHGRDPDEVLVLNGACEAFWLLATALRPRRAACVHPGFTEPEAALRGVGCEITRVFRQPDGWWLDPGEVPTDAELVVVGNPDNPTGALGSLSALCRDGGLLVVDESFMDFVAGESESLTGDPSVVVVRSLTKLWSLAGIRAGYLLGPRALVTRLAACRQPWSVNSLACAALAWCSADLETPARVAREVAVERELLVAQLAERPFVRRVWPSAANFLLVEVIDGPAVVAALLDREIAVRPAESFPGLGPNHVRLAVRRRGDNERLLAALAELG